MNGKRFDHLKADSGGCTDKDMVLQLQIVDGAAAPDALMIENLVLSMNDHDAESIGAQFRAALAARNLTSLKRAVLASDHGGPETRRRHYEFDIRKGATLGRVYL